MTMAVFSYCFQTGFRMMMSMITMILLHCLIKTSSAFPLLPLMQMYYPLGRLPQQTEVLSRYFVFGNHLMQPKISQTQMLPVVFTQVGKQGLQSDSDSEEGLVVEVLMMPVDPGLQVNTVTTHHAGVSISGTDGGNVAIQPAINPIGQQGINITVQTNESVLVVSDLPHLVQPEWGRDDSPGAGIIKPTYSPPIGLRQTPAYSEPTVPSEINGGDFTEGPTQVTENWILCNSYMPDHEEYQGLTRGDGHVPVMAPKYFLIPNMFDDEKLNYEAVV